mgnify:CR=1 FL=1
MQDTRRLFLKGALGTAALGVAVSAGLLKPGRVLAATWPKAAFEAEEVDVVMDTLFGTTEAKATDKINLRAPDIAENGAVVPVTVEADMDNVQSISIVAVQNGTPLTSSYELSSKSLPYVSNRIKMGQTSDVVAMVKTTDGAVMMTKKEVKVTIGGCGG